MSCLTVAVSTLSEDLDSTIAQLESYDFNGDVKILIISQREDKDETIRLADNILLIKSSSSGLSVSRNLAISRCETDWIWFQDSDFVPVEGAVKKIYKFIDSDLYDVLLGRINSLERPAESMKDYRRYRVNKVFLSFRISSIEIIARVSFLKRNNILFNENMGLGTVFPSCEENLFFYSAVCEQRGRLGLIDEPICLHTTLVESRNIDFASRYKARGYLLRRIPPIYSIPVGFWWIVRPTGDGVNRIERATSLARGFLVAGGDAL